VSGRIIDIHGRTARVELGEGIEASCQLSEANADPVNSSKKPDSTGKADLSSLTSMLQARWKGGEVSHAKQAEPARAGQIRNFRIKTIEAGKKQITVELLA
jgi:small subunit ribosomal protein S1